MSQATSRHIDVRIATYNIHRCRGMDRGAVRRCFEQRFDAIRMARDYEDLYLRMVEGTPRRMKA